MSEKVITIGIKREKGFLYFIDKEGQVSRTKTKKRGSKEQATIEQLTEGEPLVREKGWLYFIDKDGDISRSPMRRN